MKRGTAAYWRGMRRERLVNLLMATALAAFLLAARLAWIQLGRGPDLSLQAFEALSDTFPLELPRGHILGRGLEFLSPPSHRRPVLAYRPRIPSFPRMGRDFFELSSLLKLTPTELYRRLYTGDGFVLLADHVSGGEARRLKQLGVPGVAAAGAVVRAGPGTAALVAGTVDEGQNRGESGLELVFDEVLRGAGPRVIAAFRPPLPAGGRPAPVSQGAGIFRGAPPSPWYEIDAIGTGGDIITTLNGPWQRRVEDLLAGGLSGRQGRGAAVIMDAHTGDVLVMAAYSGGGQSDNPALKAYPAGEVFRLITAAAALEAGAALPGDRFPCRGYVDVGSRRMSSPCPGPNDAGTAITFEEAMASGSREVFARLAVNLGDAVLETASKFGLASASGLPLPGEETGSLPRPVQLKNAEDLVVLATGLGGDSRGPSASPLQMAGAASVIVNRGRRVAPRLVEEIRTAAGALIEAFPPGPAEPVVSPETARWLRQALARSGGYIADPHRGWAIGFAPKAMPRYSIAVLVEPPAPGVTAEVIFRRIAARVGAGIP